MRRLFEDARKEITAFVEQRDDLFLFLSCSGNDAPVALKLIQEAEQASASDVYLCFTDPFVQPAAYVSVLVERLREEHRLAQQFAAESGKPPLPPIPAELADETAEPPLRLWRALVFAGGLLPVSGGHRLVVSLMPLDNHDPLEFVRLLWGLLPWQGPEPWMSRLRLIVRDPGIRTLAPEVSRAPGIRYRALDFGPQAIESSLMQEVENEELPEAARMESLLMSASIDLSFNRPHEALTKFGPLLGYFQKTGNLPMQAFVLNSFGEYYTRIGDFEKAQDWYERALVPATESKDAYTLSVVGRSLGENAYRSGRLAEAEAYFDGCDKLAAHSLDVEGKIRALEWKGLSQELRGAYQVASATYGDAITLARNIGLPAFLLHMLGHLERVYGHLGDQARVAAIRQERGQLAAGAAS